MATAAPSNVSETSTKLRGIQPIRAAEGHSFLLRRLHSLSGIIPIGAFLLEHFISNAAATNGPHAFAEQVKFLTGLPFVLWLEIFGIYIPILFHALYGIHIWWQGESNIGAYPWTGNWMYTAQRWTGIIAFAYMIQHTWYLRFSGVHLMDNPGASFAKVQGELMIPWKLGFYIIAIIAASWHFAYGIYLFAAKWGITVGERARKRFGVVCLGLACLLITIGLLTVRAYFNPQWRNDYVQQSLHDRSKAKAIEKGEDPMSQQPSVNPGHKD